MSPKKALKLEILTIRDMKTDAVKISIKLNSLNTRIHNFKTQIPHSYHSLSNSIRVSYFNHNQLVKDFDILIQQLEMELEK